MMETFQLPIREIEEKFTRSELVLMAWRSQEQSYHLNKKIKDTKQDSKKRKEYMDGIGPEVMPDEFFAEKDIYDEKGRLVASKGDFNLQQVKGEDARRYFEQVLRIPMPPGVSKIAADDPMTREIRDAYGIRR